MSSSIWQQAISFASLYKARLFISPLIDRNIGRQRFAHVNLPGTADARTFSRVEFAIVRNPARHAANCENHREHLYWNPDGSHADTAIKINIWIKLALDEIGVIQSGLFQPASYIQQWIVDLEGFQQRIAFPPDDLRTWIEIFVNTMAETHQPAPAFLILGRCE